MLVGFPPDEICLVEKRPRFPTHYILLDTFIVRDMSRVNDKNLSARQG